MQLNWKLHNKSIMFKRDIFFGFIVFFTHHRFNISSQCPSLTMLSPWLQHSYYWGKLVCCGGNEAITVRLRKKVIDMDTDRSGYRSIETVCLLYSVLSF